MTRQKAVNLDLSNMAQATVKGRAAGAGTGVPQDLTAAQVAAILAGLFGDVVGPASAINGHLAVFDTTTGKLIKDGGAVPAGGGDISGTGVAGQVAEFVTNTKTLQAAKIIGPATNILTISNAAAATLALAITAAKTLTLTAVDNFNLTIPATGTVALLATANVFTAVQKINVNNALALLVEQTGVNNNVLVVDTANNFIRLLGNGALQTSGADNWQLRENFIPGTNRLLDTSKPSWALVMGDSTWDSISFYRAPATAGVPGYTVIWRFDSTGSLTMAGSLQIGTAGSYSWNGTAPITRDSGTGEIVWTLQNYASAGIRIVGGVSVIKPFTIQALTTTTNAVRESLRLEALVSTASAGGAAGFGPAQNFFAETATDGTSQQQAQIAAVWVDATNATRKAKLQLSAYDTAARLGIEIEASGSAAKIGLYGATTVIRATTAGAAGAFVSNTSATLNDTATYGGYTIGQIAQALINIGILT